MFPAEKFPSLWWPPPAPLTRAPLMIWKELPPFAADINCGSTWMEPTRLRLPILNCRVRAPGDEEQTSVANLAVVEEVTRDGRRWISETKVAGHSVIRIMIVSYLTGKKQIADLQAAMTAAAEKALGGKA